MRWPRICARSASAPNELVGLSRRAQRRCRRSASSPSSRPAAPTCRSTRSTRPSASRSCSRMRGVRVVLTQRPLAVRALRALPVTSICLDEPLARPTPPRAPAGECRSRRGPGLRHLHLGLDRPAQGRRASRTATCCACSRPPTHWFGFGPARRLDAVPLLRLRLLGLGDLGRAALRRPPRGRAVRTSAAPGGVPRAADRASASPCSTRPRPAFRQLIEADRAAAARRVRAALRRSSAARRWSCRACGPGSSATAMHSRGSSTCTASPRRPCT